jgi:hypothetical protein
MPNLTGKIEIVDSSGAVVMTWDAETGQASIGGGWVAKTGPHGHAGGLTINDQYGKVRVEIGSNATITAGGPGQHGILSLHDASSATAPRILLNAESKSLHINTSDPSNPANPSGSYEVIGLDGTTGDVAAGGNGVDAELALFPAGVHVSRPVTEKKRAAIHMQAQTATIRCGVSGTPGRIVVLNGSEAILADIRESNGLAFMGLGAQGLDGRIAVFDGSGKSQIIIDGKAGDISFGNADCAEEFDLIADERVEPGAVMVLDPEGRLRLSDQPYDRKVAGVLSGAGGFKPGITLDRKSCAGPRGALAVIGKVYCKATAAREAIETGDLLTTSAIPGHAMRAGDSRRAFGAVIGKALAGLRTGEGLIPVLVALQ